MSTSFRLRVLTPRGLEFEETVSAVTLPSSNGEIGILPDHTKYTGLLGTGVMSYVTAEGGQPVRLVVSGGFATFDHGLLTVLGDAIDTPESVDAKSYAQERESLQATLKSGGPADAQWVMAEEKLARIEAIDRLISH